MNEYSLSKRLKAVADLVPKNSRLGDIGSDHGYLASYLLLKGQITAAVCGEVVPGPYQQTLEQIEKSKLTAQVTVRLADGLEAIEESHQLTCITICGMGGKLIRDILAAGKEKLTPAMTLILQANVGEHLLREWLVAENYVITQEVILEENNKTYEIIKAEKAPAQVLLTPAELLFGPILLQAKENQVFQAKWLREYHNKERILNQLLAAKDVEPAKVTYFQQELALIKEVLV